MKSCCVIGHRKIENIKKVYIDLKKILKYLIRYDYIDTFKFSSKSDFVDLAWHIIKELQINKYPFIQMIAYDCKNESSLLKEDFFVEQSFLNTFTKRQIQLKYFDSVVECKVCYNVGKNSYIERNKKLINESDICIFYYDNKYVPLIKKITPYSKWYKNCFYLC